MKITITAIMLCDLLGGKFTLEACEGPVRLVRGCGNQRLRSRHWRYRLLL